VKHKTKLRKNEVLVQVLSFRWSDEKYYVAESKNFQGLAATSLFRVLSAAFRCTF